MGISFRKEEVIKNYEDYKNTSARDISKKISSGELKPQHIGPKSIEVKKQELISHIQNYQETFSRQETKAWKVKFQELSEAAQF